MSTITASFDPALQDAVGVITYWSGASGVRVAGLKDALAANGRGLAHLAPEAPSPETRVRRAVDAAVAKGYIHRPGAAGGRSIVREGKDGERLRHAEVLHAKWTATGLTVTVIEDTPHVQAMADEIRDRFREDEDVLNSEDLTVWLQVRVTRTCAGVGLRRAGGMYFVPRSLVPILCTIRDAVREQEVGAVVYQIPAMDGAEAAMAVLDALRAEAEQRVEEIERDILKGDLQRKALDNRSDRLNELAEKLSDYADELSLDVADLRSTVEKAQAAVTAAILGLAADERTEATAS